MKTRVLIVAQMQSPPGVWLSPHNSVAHRREEASTFPSKAAAEIRAQAFAATYPKRGKEELMFLYIESND